MIGHGNVNVQTSGNVGSLFNDLKVAIENAGTGDLMTTVNAIRGALAPEMSNTALIGVVGGEGHLDDGLLDALDKENGLGGIVDGLMPGLVDKVQNISTVEPGQKDIYISDGDIRYTVGDGKNSPVIIGAIGGDLSVNTGLNLEIPLMQKEFSGENTTSIYREGNIQMDIQSGNVLGGIGASTAIAVGNIDINGQVMTEDSDSEQEGNQTLYWVDGGLNGTTSTTIDGSVNVNVANGANVGGFFTGGAAIAVGGNATSTVTGSTTVTTESEVELQTAINGVTAGITGGGAAVSTNGGTATSTVGGDSTIDVTNGLSIGLIGGGAAASVDATGVAEAIYELANSSEIQYGQNNGAVTIEGSTLGDIGQLVDNIAVTGATSGGKATADVNGETNINLKGNTTAVGLIGGGMAVASHTYTVRSESEGAGPIPEGYAVNDSYGFSNATASTGKSNITVNLAGAANVGDLGDAVKGIISGIEGGNLDRASLDKLKGQGMALGIFGGGVAVGQGSLRGMLSENNGATAIANTEGSKISLESGYAAAVFGGGAAVTINNARAKAEMTGDVNITTENGMKTVGLFGGGLALSMEGSVGSDGYTAHPKEILANSKVGTVNITNKGDTDGIFGGGMAIGNSNRNVSSEDETLQSDAVSSVQTSNITVEAGTVDAMQIEAFMDATKNNNDDGYPWWNRLGYNASAAMADLKGITDKTSIAAGGLGMGMTGKAEVTTANVTIAGEDTVIAKDILGGGIAIDNLKEGSGAHVGTSTINLKSGATVEGSVYAGGAVNGTTLGELNGNEDFMVEGHTGYDTTNTSSKVDTAIVNLNGTTIAGEISGQGYELTTNYGKDNNYNPYHDGNSLSYDKKFYESVKDSTLNFIGENTLSALGEGDYTGDGSKIHDFDNINFKSGSSTKLDGETVKVNSTALIDADGGTVKVEDGAYLDISELKSGFESGGTGTANTYKVVTEADKDSSIFWDDSDFLYDRVHSGVFAVVDETAGDGNFNVTYEKIDETNIDAAAQSMAESFNWYEGTGMFYGMIGNRGEGTNTGADEFFKDAQMAANKVPYQKGLMIGEDAAVTGNTVAIARDMADNVMQRLSFTDDYVQDAGWVNNDGGIWAKYIHRKYETENMGSSFGGIHSSTDYDGAIVGVDFAKHGNFQSGVAFHYGSGDGNGLISRNDYDAWGFTLYGSLKDEEAGTNLMADIGYVTSDNDIDGTVNGKSLSADRAVDAWTIGLRGEKEYAFGQNQLVPYVGLRYMSVNPGRYTSYYGGQKAFDYDADNQNLWLLPIGVSFRNETVTDSGWRITPKLDLSYIWAFGDTDTDMTVNAGADYTGNLYYDVMDDNSWLASLGVEATKDVWSFGVGYGYQKGDDTKNKTWFVNASYAF